ncbi:MAG TPA: hypothetical protein ENF48_02150 [Desulfobacteraceae bacterium]|nr:hypothetical protein [Deltaproteobacteria bacterium]MBW2357001.1 hypothetical protein [Deltaproteobacteria bacterium]RLB97314.1 MAG: hypothetical protein DRH76_05195 [Deltaproteobacteria bacterium]HDI59153.1 hypothetical protein [Desulfobacteraceae bacterium]
MDVPSYQMHRVLKLYAKRLEHIAEARRHLSAEGLASAVETRRQSLMDRVAATIIRRIQEIGPQLGADGKRQVAGLGPVGQADKSRDRAREFRFYRIDNRGRKRLASLVIDSGDFVFQRVEALLPPPVER